MPNQLSLPSKTNLNIAVSNKILEQRGKPSQVWDLVPISDLHLAIQGLEAAAVPSEKEIAKNAAKILLGSYPRHAVDDPAIYARGIVSVFMRFPPHVGKEAIDNLSLKSKFIPTRAEVNAHCALIMSDLSTAITIARRMVIEHDLRKKEQDRDAKVKADRQKFRDQHKGKTMLEVIKAEKRRPGDKSEPEIRDKARRIEGHKETAQRQKQTN
tara:strand:- start:20715 stop:21350 length:636 start_codon:yes stop_codon:yes gene_type:complete